MAIYSQDSVENTKYHKGCFRLWERQAPKIEPKNLRSSVIACRNGRILTIKCQTTVRSEASSRSFLDAHQLHGDLRPLTKAPLRRTAMPHKQRPKFQEYRKGRLTEATQPAPV
ncbi:hypothetical protein ASC96_29355 [Rhizobium sp. Root1204]|nr:hypothetical protein ASC96_29355 [Rhizobium sp. Root1204]